MKSNISYLRVGKLDVLGLLGDYPDHVVHTIPRLCQWTRDSILQVKKKPTWLRNRYKLVRYEDFALDPLRVAKELYEFVGINFPRSVVNWIVMNTRTNDERSVKLFSTHKNSVHDRDAVADVLETGSGEAGGGCVRGSHGTPGLQESCNASGVNEPKHSADGPASH